MSNLESTVVFEARAREIGIEESELAVRRGKRWNTFGAFAFSTTYVPQGGDEAKLLKLVATVTGSGASEPPDERIPPISRLFFEAYTLAAADLKQRVAQKPSDEPKPWAMPERVSRLNNHKARLAGVKTEGQSEPSYALNDFVSGMREFNQLQYCPWDKCTTRDQEIMNIKVKKIWKPDGSGLIREHNVKEELQADMSTDLMLADTFRRSSLSFDQNSLASYAKIEAWSTIMLEAYTTPPPLNFRRVSIEQLHRADLKLFKLMIEETREGIRPTLSGKPMDAALDKFMRHPDVRLVLQPLQGKEDEGYPSTPASKRKLPESEESMIMKLQKTIENQAGQIKNLQKKKLGSHQGGGAVQKHPFPLTPHGGQGGSKAAGKSKTAGKIKTTTRMPAQLIGLSPQNAQGEAICFGYNLGTCTGAADGETCPKGWHVCMKPGCFKAHSQLNHQ